MRLFKAAWLLVTLALAVLARPSAVLAQCSGGCAAAAPQALSSEEVRRVISQAVVEAQAHGVAATIAVVDRVGNVLGVYAMFGASPRFLVTSGRQPPAMGGLENVDIVPSAFGAIAKAITGAYLSSEGNAFSTRTASQIVQENFNPFELNSPGGPLFGVQFSSLACSDITRSASTGSAGPHGSPLGLSADPGGLPLYKGGTVVGGVGVLADGIYGLDADIYDEDRSADELIAVAAARGFDAPIDRRAERISVDGRTLRYVDSEALLTAPASAPPLEVLPGAFLWVPGYSGGGVMAGTAFGTVPSGIRPSTDPELAALNGYVLDNGSGINRYPPRSGTDGLMAEAEVRRILVEALRVANRARAQIRRPLGSSAQVTISVVDTLGEVVGLVRTPDAPVFGIDVSVQKARSALLFSHPVAAAELSMHPASGPYVPGFLRLIPGGLANGIAYSNRAIGNLARPFFPDGINGNPPGPLSNGFPNWSPFNVGLQLDLVVGAIVRNIGPDPQPPCTDLPRAKNGIQIFAGSVPIYRAATLVGAIGISGDGIDQDDMVAFLGLANAGFVLGTGIGNAPAAQRADQIPNLPGGQLRYVNCPIAPFLDTDASDVCGGI
jgi:uncharacterized protein GlcG (DUF336 family)